MPSSHPPLRDRLYTQKRTIAFSRKQEQRLLRAAEKCDTAVATIVREAVEKGLRQAVDTRRKRKARADAPH